MAGGGKGSDGVIWRAFHKQMSMLDAAREFGFYYVGLTIRAIANKQCVSVIDVIAGICDTECPADFLRKCLAISDQMDSPPTLPNPDDLTDYVRQQVAVELAA